MKTDLMISVSGVRGILGESLTPENIQQAVLAFASLLTGKTKTVVIGRDTRPSGLAIEHIVAGTLMSCGVNVVHLGICPTPTVAMSVKKLFASGGIVLTASHNSIKWNALKLINSKGFFLNEEECQQFLSIWQTKSFSYATALSFGLERRYSKACEDHIELLLNILDVELIARSGFRVFLDSVNGSGSEITPLFLKKMGCTVVTSHCDINKIFPRNPEPTQKYLQKVCAQVKQTPCDIAFVQDPDADRLAIIQSNGDYVPEELTLALAFESVLSVSTGQKILVANNSSSSLLDKIAQKYGARLLRTKVGEVHVVSEIVKHNALIGGEGNGGVIYPRTHLGRDSLIAIGLILELLARNKSLFDSVLAEQKNFHMIKHQIEISNQKFDKKKLLLEKAFPDTTPCYLDGYKYIGDDFWVQMRMSNTEPIARIFIEAQSHKKMSSLLDKTLHVLEEN